MSEILDPHRGERGSAYIAVLLALVVLTIIGLSLVMVTETEVHLGSNERTITRTLFAADAGLQVAVVRHVMGPENDAFTFIQNRTQTGEQIQIAEQVQQSAFQQLSWADCDWCPTNENDQQYKDDNYAVTTTGQRVAWSGSNTSLPPAGSKVLSQTQVTTMIRITNEAQQPLDPQSKP